MFRIMENAKSSNLCVPQSCEDFAVTFVQHVFEKLDDAPSVASGALRSLDTELSWWLCQGEISEGTKMGCDLGLLEGRELGFHFLEQLPMLLLG